MHRFCRYDLRTTDVERARSFYGELLGHDFLGDGISVGPLPPHVAARGAPAHWLGHILVNDAATLSQLVALGATPLGPPPQGGTPVTAVVRDPSGAILGITSENGLRRPERVAWHLLNAQDEAQAFRVYSDVFGWVALDTTDLGADRGRHVAFAWDQEGHQAGSVSNMARLPGVHPQWLFFFATADLDGSLATVRRHGGLALPVTETADGHRVAVCDDPQGAAFALYVP